MSTSCSSPTCRTPSPCHGQHCIPIGLYPRYPPPRGPPSYPTGQHPAALPTHLEDILRGDGGGIRLADDALVGAGPGRLLPRLAEPPQRALHGARPPGSEQRPPRPLRLPAGRETEWRPPPRHGPGRPAAEPAGGGESGRGRSAAAPGREKRSRPGPPLPPGARRGLRVSRLRGLLALPGRGGDRASAKRQRSGSSLRGRSPALSREKPGSLRGRSPIPSGKKPGFLKGEKPGSFRRRRQRAVPRPAACGGVNVGREPSTHAYYYYFFCLFNSLSAARFS